MKVSAIAVAALLSAGGAQAQEAHQWTVGGEANGYFQIYDQLNVQTSGRSRTVWELMTVRETSVYEGRPYDYLHIRTTYDCQRSRYRYSYVRAYLKSSPEPTFAFDRNGPWNPAVPGTTHGQTMARVCSDGQYETFSETGDLFTLYTMSALSL